MNRLVNKLGLAFSFALRDISKSKAVLGLTVSSLGMAYAVIFLSGGILSGFSDALRSGSIDTSGEITVYFNEKNTDNKINEIGEVLHSIENVGAASVRTYGGYLFLGGAPLKVVPGMPLSE